MRNGGGGFAARVARGADRRRHGRASPPAPAGSARARVVGGSGHLIPLLRSEAPAAAWRSRLGRACRGLLAPCRRDLAPRVSPGTCAAPRPRYRRLAGRTLVAVPCHARSVRPPLPPLRGRLSAAHSAPHPRAWSAAAAPGTRAGRGGLVLSRDGDEIRAVRGIRRRIWGPRAAAAAAGIRGRRLENGGGRQQLKAALGRLQRRVRRQRLSSRATPSPRPRLCHPPPTHRSPAAGDSPGGPLRGLAPAPPHTHTPRPVLAGRPSHPRPCVGS